jgi:RNA polymerase sigma-70 factor (ECF subfamily)
MIFESTFAPWRRTFIEERGKDIIFIEIMNRLEQEMLQTKEFQDVVQEAIKNKGRAFVPEDIFDYPVLKQHFMDFIRTMIPIMIFDLIVERYQLLLYALAMRILNNHHSTEDVVQESLMKAYVALKSYSKEQLQTLRIRPWLCAIVRNTANNYRVQERRFELLDLSEDSELLEIEGNRFEQPELAIMVNETANEFHEIIRRLPQQYRAVVLLRFMEEFKSKELAQAMNISNMNTLKSYMGIFA